MPKKCFFELQKAQKSGLIRSKSKLLCTESHIRCRKGPCVESKQIKSRRRVTEYGEVNTGEREVKAMCDLVKSETERIDSRFLEPACGDGNFLAEILTRKLSCDQLKKYRRSPYDWERNSLLAIGSLYGVDILADNCEACRERLYCLWDAEYRKVCRTECNDNTRASARFILARNIVCGNALSLMCVDGNGKDTAIPIVFSEWTFPFNDGRLQRKDYTFDELLHAEEEKTPGKKSAQQSLFADSHRPDGEGKFLQQYITHYRRLADHE